MPVTSDTPTPASARSAGVSFTTWPGGRHLAVLAALMLLCAFMYSHVTGAPFQFDDEPNITKCPAIKMKTLSWRHMKRAVTQSTAPNRILVSASFALQYWAAQFLPRIIDQDPSHPTLLSWQFRMFNYFVHIGAGFVIYLLMLRLLQLPRVEKHLARHAWPLATAVAFIWFCSPVQTQAVTYIVQRAASMAALFYALGLLCYLQARAAHGRSIPIQTLWFGLALLACACSIFSKEIGATFPLAVVVVEYLLIRQPRVSGRYMAGVVLLFGALAFCGMVWIYGRATKELKDGHKVTVISLRLAWREAYDDIVGKVLRDHVVNRKIRLSPRQRLLTETRVVAMYQTLLVLPAPWRLNLDYDFLESTELFVPGEYATAGQILPLILVLAVPTVLLLLPSAWRIRAFVILLAILAATSILAYAIRPPTQNTDFVLFASVWQQPWPVPALLWHALVLGFAALYSFRRPLLVFGLVFFYLANLIESTIIVLEIVHEHRLYLSSMGFYLTLTVLLFEALVPAREEDLGPKPIALERGARTMHAEEA